MGIFYPLFSPLCFVFFSKFRIAKTATFYVLPEARLSPRKHKQNDGFMLVSDLNQLVIYPITYDGESGGHGGTVVGMLPRSPTRFKKHNSLLPRLSLFLRFLSSYCRLLTRPYVSLPIMLLYTVYLIISISGRSP